MITLLGDLAFNGLISSEPEKNPDRFSDVITILSESDLVFANLEVPVRSGDSKNEYKTLIHYSLPEPTYDLLKMMNISCVSLANNHIYDFTMPGLEATILLLDQAGIRHTGAGWLSHHTEPVMLNLNGKTIAFMAYVDKSTNPNVTNFPELKLNVFEVSRVISDIQAVRKSADHVICSLHWGNDYSIYPDPEQVKHARLLADAGADIIMGHHPHTLQPFEKYNDSYIFYSLGGLTFGDFKKEGSDQMRSLYRRTKNGVIVEYSPDSKHMAFISTNEKKGNFITLTNRDFSKWSNRKWHHYRIKNSCSFMHAMYEFNEKIMSRIWEYFFGYYHSPLKRLFQFSNISKLGRLFR